MRGRQHGCLHGVAKVGDCLRLSAALSIATEHGRKVFVLDHKYQALSVVARSGVSGEHKRGRRAARELIAHGLSAVVEVGREVPTEGRALALLLREPAGKLADV